MIKLFEEYNSRFYEEIEWRDVYVLNKIDDKKQCARVGDRLEKLLKDYYTLSYDTDVYLGPTLYLITIRLKQYDFKIGRSGSTGAMSYSGRLRCRIYLLGDDYYLVVFNSKFGGPERFYKCDQFDGLVNLLEDQTII
jgi:hypothetical protein